MVGRSIHSDCTIYTILANITYISMTQTFIYDAILFWSLKGLKLLLLLKMKLSFAFPLQKGEQRLYAQCYHPIVCYRL